MAQHGEIGFEHRLNGRGTAARDAGLLQFGAALLAVVSFKIFLALHIGAGAFHAMLAEWSQSGLAEQLAAKLFTLDAVSQMLVNVLGHLPG